MDNPPPPPASTTPLAELAIDEALVNRLLREQYPDLAHLPLRSIGEGWDNVIFRLGEPHAVRLPRRAVAARFITHEQRWLPFLSTLVTLPIPAPLCTGKPSSEYPWDWSIVPWLDGLPADEQPPAAAQAATFGAFLRSLHVPAPLEAPLNPVRGGPLTQRAATVESRIERLALRTNLITARLRKTWEEACSAALDRQPTWLHGDLHPRNVLVRDGVIAGIIDWGDLCAGDPATDLAASWTLFAEARARQELWTAYGGISAPTAQRAKGWALLFGVMLLDTGLNDNPRNAAIGERILTRLSGDP